MSCIIGILTRKSNYFKGLGYETEVNIVKAYSRTAESMNIFVRPSNMFSFSKKSIGVWTRSFWNNIGECYTVVLKYVVFNNIFSPLPLGKMATAIAPQRETS